MPCGKIVSIHSYRGGTGKSNVTANIAAHAAMTGKRVAVMDTDLQSPGIHVLFGIRREDIKTTLVDFLWGKCSIEETAYNVSQRISSEMKGECWLVPASLTTQAISRIIEEGYDADRLNTHFDELLKVLNLDYLFIDTHPGLNKETLLTTAISDVLIILIRPDQQDYYGSAVISEVANKLEIPHIYMICNKVFTNQNEEQLKQQITQVFGYDVLGVIPLSEDWARLESGSLIVVTNPHHRVSLALNDITERLVGGTGSGIE
jgi:septum site-determining protein MinD